MQTRPAAMMTRRVSDSEPEPIPHRPSRPALPPRHDVGALAPWYRLKERPYRAALSQHAVLARSAPQYVFIKRVGDASFDGEVFTKLPLEGCEDVADVAVRACKEFPSWGLHGGQVKLFLVSVEATEPSPGELDSALSGAPLSVFRTLADAGVVSGSCLLAHTPPPAAAPSASLCARVRRAGLCLPRGFPVFRAQRLESRSVLPFFLTTSLPPLQPSPHPRCSG